MSNVNEAEMNYFQSRGFGMTLGFGQQPVLIVIDLFNAFTDPEMDLGSNLDKEIAATNRLIDSAQEFSVPVIFTRVIYEQDDFSDAGIWFKKQRGCQALRPGTRAVEFDSRLHRLSTDTVLFKKFASCFFGTDLASRLIVRGADTLVIAGCSTSGCVRATAIDACQYGFRPMIVREAVGDRSRAAHEQSLFDLHSRYGDVVAIEEVLAYFQSRCAA